MSVPLQDGFFSVCSNKPVWRQIGLHECDVPLFVDNSTVLDGVDPSFLAALPDFIRQEVIADQLRLYQLQQQAQRQQEQAEALGVPEVNPEFLAALPAHIQEEVGF